MDSQYELLDSGDQRKLERFGEVVVDRPRGGAVWAPQFGDKAWGSANARFERENSNEWTVLSKLPKRWQVSVEGVNFWLEPTAFGHLGLFPEHAGSWRWMRERIGNAGRPVSVLNLFGYTGGATLVAAKAGATVCHLDASKKTMTWARENAELNKLQDAPIRWITDDVMKFLEREIRRDNRYEGIILDPPNFGRGTRNEVFKIDTHIRPLLELCRGLLSKKPLFVILTCHALPFSPLVLQHLVQQMMAPLSGTITGGEMVLTGGEKVLPIPNGACATWETDR